MPNELLQEIAKSSPFAALCAFVLWIMYKNYKNSLGVLDRNFNTTLSIIRETHIDNVKNLKEVNS